MRYRRAGEILGLASSLPLIVAAPSGFPSSGNGLWYTQPGDIDSWSTQWLPIGNGFLAAMMPGGTSQETTQLNIESLWSGGPFQDPTYNGGNKQPYERSAMAQAMQTIRQTIFQSPNGTIDNIEVLATDAGAYGSYVGSGYLLSTMNSSDTITYHGRYLDLDAAVHRTQWTQDNTTFVRESFCSHPAQACIQHVNTTDASIIPDLTFAISSAIESGLPTPNITCFDNATLRFTGLASDPGMTYELLARVRTESNGTISCVPSAGNATLTVVGSRDAWITWVGGTNYDMDAGNVAHNFSFRGVDPHDALVTLLDSATSSSASYSSLFSAHVADYKSIISPFSLSLGQSPDLSNPTDQLRAGYATDVGNPYLEWLLFNYGRYLLASSARGLLPANLQGKWASDSSNPWGADYHADINVQMNYWFAEMTNMNVVGSLFNYIEKTWAPRGAQTAQILYNISKGWVTHDEMNIFGHTGMKGGGNVAMWSDYPESSVWMMLHVWDHFDYTNDIQWFISQGWPLLKSVAEFHLEKLIPDLHFNDSTLVVAPCNSPEQVPITLGCSHAQQVIWQLFNAIEKGYAASGDTDTALLQEVRSKVAQMDKGIHIGSWGQLQEWKVDMDSPSDTHRHLSHLVGLYPGYAVSSYNPSIQAVTGHNYSKSDVLQAAEISLFHRGNGTGPDADAGWEKVWRAACWAQLANSSEFYHELSYSLERNFGTNLFSLYTPGDPHSIFQIDANFGFPAALLNGLIQAPDVASISTPLIVNILPALPSNWPSGFITGARLRGAITLDLEWARGKPMSATFSVDRGARARPVQVMYAGETVASFTTAGGSTKKVTF
ncbi:putative alpha-fucosidase A [Grifola frondosa]|uniref:Putative alpha-fucosidase A n=1 Tax=Grifola frondosa TaxID=5627 RepID=A0A1C7MLN5_GRIFR|nr:putative alpha-fucosidase A [Grifola frondosa]